MNRHRAEAAITATPEVVADEMAHATQRLREQGWMIAPLTKPLAARPSPRHRRERRSVFRWVLDRRHVPR